MNPANQPIFCFEGFELENPPRNMQENLSTPYFHLRVRIREKEQEAAVTLRELVKAC